MATRTGWNFTMSYFFRPLKETKEEIRFFIFTCLITRAVHLEVTFSLSTDSDSFIMCQTVNYYKGQTNCHLLWQRDKLRSSTLRVM